MTWRVVAIVDEINWAVAKQWLLVWSLSGRFHGLYPTRNVGFLEWGKPHFTMVVFRLRTLVIHDFGDSGYPHDLGHLHVPYKPSWTIRRAFSRATHFDKGVLDTGGPIISWHVSHSSQEWRAKKKTHLASGKLTSSYWTWLIQFDDLHRTSLFSTAVVWTIPKVLHFCSRTCSGFFTK